MINKVIAVSTFQNSQFSHLPVINTLRKKNGYLGLRLYFVVLLLLNLTKQISWDCGCYKRGLSLYEKVSSLLPSVTLSSIWESIVSLRGFPGGSDSKESTCNVGDLGSIPGLGGSPGVGDGNPLQYSSLENSRDRGAWQATVHGVSKTHDWVTKPSTVQYPWAQKRPCAWWRHSSCRVQGEVWSTNWMPGARWWSQIWQIPKETLRKKMSKPPSLQLLIIKINGQNPLLPSQRWL